MIKRRKFLWLALFGFLVVAGIAWFYRLRYGAETRKSWEPLSLAEICTREKMIDLGVAYRLISGENNPDSLMSILAIDPSSLFIDQQKKLDQKIREDFQNDNTVMIDGWLLSITEARQCALLSLKTPE